MAAEFHNPVANDQENAPGAPREARFGYLLAALVGLIILYPFLDDTPLAHLAIAAINSAILVAAAFAASHSRRTMLLALMLAAPVLALEWLHTIHRDPVIDDFKYAAVALFYGFTIFHVLGEVLRPGTVTRDKISGAVAAYMLAAVGWTTLYGLVDSLVPGSFSMSGQSDLGHPLTVRDLLYFSFTTLTTTGYGDVTPVSRHAQSLAILEQMAGVFYVAILIARLAGHYQPRTTRHSDRKGRD